jgi:hypothetical protein
MSELKLRPPENLALICPRRCLGRSCCERRGQVLDPPLLNATAATAIAAARRERKARSEKNVAIVSSDFRRGDCSDLWHRLKPMLLKADLRLC